MAINQITDKVVTKWIIDPGTSQKELTNLRKEFQRQAKQEAELDKIKKELNKTVEKQNKALASLKNSFVVSSIKANLYTAAIRGIKDFLSETIKTTGDYNRALNAFKGNLDLARNATSGLVSDLELMRTANQLNTLGVKLSDEQYASLLQGVTKLSDAMGISMKDALSSTATALSRQSVMIADNIGVTIKVGEANDKFAASLGKTADELTANEKKLAFQREFLDQVAEKAGELPERLNTMTDALLKADTSITNTFSKWAAHIDRSVGLALDQLIDRLTILRTGELGQKSIKGLLDEDRAAQLKANLEAAEAGLGLGAAYSEAQLRAATTGGGMGDIQANLMGAPMTIGRGIFKEGPEFSSLRDDPREAERKAKAAARFRQQQFAKARQEWNEQFKAIEAARREHERMMIESAQREFAEQEKLFRLMHQNEMQRQQDIRNTANAIMDMRAEQQRQVEQEKQAAFAASLTGQKQREATESFDQAKLDTLNQGVAVFGSLGSAMFQAAEAAEATGESFGSAMGKIVKATLKSVAITSTVKALESLALAAFNAAMLQPGPAALALKAAATYTATAIAAGAASAAIGGGGGGAAGAGGGARSRVRNDIYEDPQRQRPQFAKKEQARAPINIDLYIGDPNNPSSALIAKEQLNAQLSQRNQSEFSEI